MTRETITCTANEGKTYDVVFDGDEVVSVDVVQQRAHANGIQTFNRRVWTRGRGNFGPPAAEAAKSVARALRSQNGST